LAVRAWRAAIAECDRSCELEHRPAGDRHFLLDERAGLVVG
jgi:hypothetical protein